MGGSCSNNNILSEESLSDYRDLTYLAESEILHILSRFRHVRHGRENEFSTEARYPFSEIVRVFTELEHNPFRDRICQVFSSRKDNKFSFEDFLDLASAFSENCPADVRAKWAFLVYDFDGDQLINVEDIKELITRLTKKEKPRSSRRESEFSKHREELDEMEKEKIAQSLLKVMNLDGTGVVKELEFVHALSKIPEFEHTFRIKF